MRRHERDRFLRRLPGFGHDPIAHLPAMEHVLEQVDPALTPGARHSLVDAARIIQQQLRRADVHEQRRQTLEGRVDR